MHRPSKQSNLFQSNGEEQHRKTKDEIETNTVIIIIIISRRQRADVNGAGRNQTHKLEEYLAFKGWVYLTE